MHFSVLDLNIEITNGKCTGALCYKRDTSPFLVHLSSKFTLTFRLSMHQYDQNLQFFSKDLETPLIVKSH